MWLGTASQLPRDSLGLLSEKKKNTREAFDVTSEIAFWLSEMNVFKFLSATKRTKIETESHVITRA